jgi:hypothetical protein
MCKLALRITAIVITLLAGQTSPAFAAGDSVVVLKETVTGNQEQPKVLYIVPWQAADDDTILKQPIASQINDDVFEHVERQELNRELNYLQTLSRSGKTQAQK